MLKKISLDWKKDKTIIIKDKKNYIAETLKTEEVPDQESNVQEVDLWKFFQPKTSQAKI